MKEVLKNKLQESRLERGITQEALAEAVGVTRQTIIAIERGNYVPSTLLAFKLAKYFKKSIEMLFMIQHGK